MWNFDLNYQFLIVYYFIFKKINNWRLSHTFWVSDFLLGYNLIKNSLIRSEFIDFANTNLPPWHYRALCRSGRQCYSRSCRSCNRSPRQRCRSHNCQPIELWEQKCFFRVTIDQDRNWEHSSWFLGFVTHPHNSVDQGSQTQFYRRATFLRKKLSAGRSLLEKKLLQAAIKQKSPQNKLNWIKYKQYWIKFFTFVSF